MKLIQEILTELVSLPHRGSTTKEERAAADKIEKRLKESGYSTQLDSFRSPTTYSWEVVFLAALVEEIDRRESRGPFPSVDG